MIRSEHTKNFTDNEINTLQNKIMNMTPDELKNFRNSFDPDLMGFNGKEAIDDED